MPAVKPLRFRPIRASDLDAIMALENACFAPVDQFSRRRYRQLVLTARQRGSAWGLVGEAAGGELLAVAIFLLRRGMRVARLYTISVAPHARGRGLADALLHHAAAAFRRRGIGTISLEVRQSNTRARRVYERLGFVPVKTTARYYDDGETGIRYRAAVDVLCGD